MRECDGDPPVWEVECAGEPGGDRRSATELYHTGGARGNPMTR